MTNCSCILLEVPRWLSSKEFTCDAVNTVRSLAREDPLEKETAAHSSILAWESHGQRSLEAAVHGAAHDSGLNHHHPK